VVIPDRQKPVRGRLIAETVTRIPKIWKEKNDGK
jgi:hypothetical protein